MLFRNVLRTLKKQYVQLLLLGIMITLSSFIYTTMDYGVTGIQDATEAYFDDKNQEAFAISMADLLLEDEFTYVIGTCGVTQELYTLSALEQVNADCFYDIINQRKQLILHEYSGITIELREYKNVFYDLQGDSHRLRVLKDSQEINLSYIVKGTKPTNNDDIAISEIYASLNNLEIGDSFTLNDTTYTITGFVLFPDYSLALLSNDFIFDNQTQTIALMTDQGFEQLSEYVGFDWMGAYQAGMTDQEFTDTVIKDYPGNDNLPFITSIVLTVNNMRSGAIYGEIEGGQVMGLGLSILIASIAILIVGIMVSKVLQSQRGPIGILKSMGYTNTQIAKPYIFFIGMLSLPAILMGYYLGTLGAEPLRNMYLLFYLLPSEPIELNLVTFMIAVLVPLGFIMLVGYLVIKQILSKKPVELLNPQISKSASFITKRVSPLLKRLNIIHKIQSILLFRNFVKLLVFVMGMFYAAFLIYLSLSMIGIFDRSINTYYDNTHHNYIGYCDYVTPCLEAEGTQEEVIELPSVLVDQEDAYLVGLSPESSLHPLLNKKGETITSDIEDGLVISESLRLLGGFKVGDEIDVEIAGETLSTTIINVSYEYTGKAYIDKTTLSNLLTDNTDTDFYNAIYSEEELHDNDFLIVVSNQDVVDQSQSMSNMMNMITYILTGVSFILGAIIVYILTVMTIEDNFYNISLFKVIGYNKQEINKMILGGYFIYGFGIFVVTIPIAILAFSLMERLMAQVYSVIMPFDVQLWHIFVGVGLYVIIFYIGAIVAKRHLDKISLQEAMKMYQV
ncbi:ABC transporter permease [Candidatus Xianfuyuplasma coldseepsis]|uniref:ABC transporter permease n=1 Tax=Candidatus Xianfuyuplasma coldseepsis TaxID=2782163 RepID=A0A7L7KRW7_9MOLU|nr:ABC transporter permease [Xianfuyuplasma coldseepsis]QMS85570.1 ABC transporter permease [Xianfuyuplasma coldseepsis]